MMDDERHWMLRPPEPGEDPGGTERPVVTTGPTVTEWTRVGAAPGEPQDGEWPCQHPGVGAPAVAQRLVAALYRLMRDEIQPGRMESVLIDVAPYGPQSSTLFSATNEHLLSLAQAHTAYLLHGLPVGPEIIVEVRVDLGFVFRRVFNGERSMTEEFDAIRKDAGDRLALMLVGCTALYRDGTVRLRCARSSEIDFLVSLGGVVMDSDGNAATLPEADQ